MIVVEISSNNESLKNQLDQFITEEIVTYKFDGAEIIQLLIEITKVTAPVIAGVLIGKLESGKITVKKNGIEMTTKLTKKGINKIKLAEELLKLDNDDES